MENGIYCNACGAKLEEAPTLLPHQRPPCPFCGSLARRIKQTVRSNILPMPGVPPTTVERVIGVDAVAPTAEGAGIAFDATVQTINTHGTPSAAETGTASVVKGGAMRQVRTEGQSRGVRGPRRIIDHLVVQGRSLWWTQLTEEGGWLLQVVNEAGEEIADWAGYDPVDGLAAVAGYILPGHPG